MTTQMKLQKNTSIYTQGQPVNFIGTIESGSVIMKSNYFSLTLEAGQVLGLFHLSNRKAETTDIAGSDTTFECYRLEVTFPNITALKDDEKLQKAALLTIQKQFSACIKLYKQYKEQLNNVALIHTALVKKYKLLCERLQITPKITDTGISPMVSEILNKTPYVISYYNDLANLLNTTSPESFVQHKNFWHGIIMRASEDFIYIKELIERTVLAISSYSQRFFNEEYNDYFRYFSELLGKTHAGTPDFQEAKALLTTLYTCLYQLPFSDKISLQARMNEQKHRIQTMMNSSSEASSENSQSGISAILNDSVNKILAEANEDDEFSSAFIKHISAYKELVDKTVQTPFLTQLRRHLTDDFHRLYKTLALKYVRGEKVSDTVKLFLNFGYIDESLAGSQNAEELCKLLHADIFDEKEHIYTFIEWLKAIYDGKKEPSRNEFDMDYTDFLRSERVSGKITPAEEKQQLVNAEARVLYELENFFPSANKMTYGHISYYCPFFAEFNLLDSLSKGLLSASKLMRERDYARSVDYQLFYKEIIYSNPAININAEYIHKEILPDIILMPNYGSRGMMWQEVEGKKRATPCRMILPVFTPENLRNLFLHLCGEYRWEICKRIQGPHWDDPSSNCLTADYFDYLQFYKKNNELSAEAKDKVKTLLGKARNSIKEAFVMEYIVWVVSESEGAPRLNKISRNILFAHCPFSKELRQKLSNNPIYAQALQRHNNKYEQLLHRENNLCQKITSNGKEVPEEFLQEITFFSK